MKSLILALVLSTSLLANDLYTEIHGNGVYTLSQKQEANRRIKKLEREFRDKGFVHFAEKSELALDGTFRS